MKPLTCYLASREDEKVRHRHFKLQHKSARWSRGRSFSNLILRKGNEFSVSGLVFIGSIESLA